MSTKIYNGYKLLANSLDEAVTSVLSLKPILSKILTHKIIEEQLAHAITFFEETSFMVVIGKPEKKENLNKSALSLAWSEQLEKIWESKNDADKMQSVSICLYPQKITQNQETYYLLTFHSSLEMSDKFNNCIPKTMQEYAYYNNTDRPEEVTDEQWEQRSQDWEKVLTGKGLSGVPKLEGIQITLAEEMLPYYLKKHDHELIATLLKNINARVDKNNRTELYVKNYIVNQIHGVLSKEALNQNSEDVVESALDIFYKACSMYRKNELTMEQKELKTNIYQKLLFALKDEINFEDLNKPMKTIIEEVKTKLLSLSEMSPVSVDKIKVK